MVLKSSSHFDADTISIITSTVVFDEESGWDNNVDEEIVTSSKRPSYLYVERSIPDMLGERKGGKGHAIPWE